jgi:acyl carrier protein
MRAKTAKLAIPKKDISRPEGFTEVWTGALQILVEELGIEPEDLQDSAVFTDLGLDSLLLISVLNRMRSELSLELQPSTVAGCLTVRDFSDFIQSSCNESHSNTPENSVPDPYSGIPKSKWVGVLQIIAEESGVEAANLEDDITLVDLGIDSLLIVLICGRVRNEIDESFSLGPLSIYSHLRELRDLIINGGN